jgi:hypothetical protein
MAVISIPCAAPKTAPNTTMDSREEVPASRVASMYAPESALWLKPSDSRIDGLKTEMPIVWPGPQAR